MAHEMVHAFDHLRFKVNWTDNLRHAACTEVCLSTQGFLHQDSRRLTHCRFEPARSAENADGPASSSDGVNGNLLSSTKSVFAGEPFSRLVDDQTAGTRPMPSRLSMKSGRAASETRGPLTKFIDDSGFPLYFTPLLYHRAISECTICHWHCMKTKLESAHMAPYCECFAQLYSKKKTQNSELCSQKTQASMTPRRQGTAGRKGGKKKRNQNTGLPCVDHHALPSLEEPELRFASFEQCLTIQGWRWISSRGIRFSGSRIRSCWLLVTDSGMDE